MRKLASGSFITVALAVRAAQATGAGEPILTFDDGSGAVIDFDLRGSGADLRARLAIQEQAGRLAAGARTVGGMESPARTPGRPKLGVVAREVAHSADPDQPFRPIVITDSGDLDHAVHLA